MITILQIFKRYSGNMPLHNEFARLDPELFRTVACYLGGENDSCNEMEKIADRVYYLQAKDGEARWYNLSLVQQLRKIIDHEEVHLVNCHLHRTLPLGVFAASWARQKPLVIATVHGLGGSSSWKRRLQNRLWYSRVHRVVTVSEAVRRDVLVENSILGPEKVVTIHNGLRFDAFTASVASKEVLDVDEGGPIFGTVGRLSPVKNHETLIRAFGRLLEGVPGATLVIAGRGELEAHLKALACTLKIEERVVFLGFRKDIPDLLRRWDVFVFPSLREGLPLALLEAMASDLPIIATRVGGIPEIYPREPIGALVNPGDEEGLVDAMLDLARKTPQERKALGEKARKRALKDFSADVMIKKYQDLYQEAFRAWSMPRVAEDARHEKG